MTDRGPYRQTEKFAYTAVQVIPGYLDQNSVY